MTRGGSDHRNLKHSEWFHRLLSFIPITSLLNGVSLNPLVSRVLVELHSCPQVRARMSSTKFQLRNSFLHPLRAGRTCGKTCHKATIE
ncbi:hypothetical protein Hanom_Chr06g00536021 [Helianthus anomalus]